MRLVTFAETGDTDENRKGRELELLLQGQFLITAQREQTDHPITKHLGSLDQNFQGLYLGWMFPAQAASLQPEYYVCFDELELSVSVLFFTQVQSLDALYGLLKQEK